MGFIINFFEYTLSGWVYIIWLILMIIFSLACLGVVGDKVSKKRLKELKIRREKAAEEEYKKAQELVEKQAKTSGIDVEIDPTRKINKVENVVKEINTQNINVSNQAIPNTTSSFQVPQNNNTNVTQQQPQVVDNSTPTNDEKDDADNKAPAVLIINDDGTSNN